MSSYALTRAADADLEEIARYTAERWGFEQMVTYLLMFETAFRTLADFPDTGRPFLARPGYLRAESGSHVVFYSKQPDGILIARILHQRMEPRRHLPRKD